MAPTAFLIRESTLSSQPSTVFSMNERRLTIADQPAARTPASITMGLRREIDNHSLVDVVTALHLDDVRPDRDGNSFVHRRGCDPTKSLTGFGGSFLRWAMHSRAASIDVTLL